MTLGFKVTRRLAAAVAVEGEEIVFHDSRYLARHREQVEPRLRQYFERVLEQLKPDVVYVAAPSKPHTLTAHAVELLQEAAGRCGTSAVHIGGAEMRSAIALTANAKRRTMFQCSVLLWPELQDTPTPQQLAFAEAALAALVGDIKRAIG